MPYLSEALRRQMLEETRKAITAQLDTKQSLLATLAVIQDLLEQLPAARVEMPMQLKDFRNAMGALRAIELDELQQNGLLLPAANVQPRENVAAARNWERWLAFRQHPVDFLIHSDDATQAIIWGIVERYIRQPKETADVKADGRPDPQGAPQGAPQDH